MSKLKKSLGLTDGVALLVGITIGAGIFKTPDESWGFFFYI